MKTEEKATGYVKNPSSLKKRYGKKLIQVEKQEYYAVSQRQKKEWDLFIDSGKERFSNIHYITYFDNPDFRAFEKAFAALIRRHESLRTNFKVVNNELKQLVHSPDTCNFHAEFCDFSSRQNCEKVTRDFVTGLTHTALDPEKDCLIRAILIFLNDSRYVLVFIIHHIVSDAFSIEILKSEFSAIYESIVSKKNLELKPLRFQLKDYAAMEAKILDSEIGKRNLQYWQKELSGGSKHWKLSRKWMPKKPLDKSIQKYQGGRYFIALDGKILSNIKCLSARLEVPEIVFFFSSFSILLHGLLSKQKDITIASQFTARDSNELEKIVGYLTAGLFIRIQINDELSVKKFLMSVGRKYGSALDHRIYAIGKLNSTVDECCPAFLGYPIKRTGELQMIKDFNTKHHDVETAPYYPFTCHISLYNNGLIISCHYDRNVYSRAAIPAIFDRYLDIINKFIAQEDKKIIDLIS